MPVQQANATSSDSLVIKVPVPDTTGIRNNNPGNIVKTGIEWKGEVDCDSNFECFKTPMYGVRAMVLNLDKYYYRDGLVTVRDILSKWSPHHENETELLIKSFSNSLGVSHTTVLDFSKPEVVKQVVNRLILQENGGNPYIQIVSDVVDAYMLEKNNGPNGVSDSSRIYPIRGSPEDMVEEAGDSGSESSSPIRQSGNSTERLERSETASQSTDAMDTESDSPYSYLFSDSTPQTSSHLYWHNGSSWLDRVGIWIPFLYGWTRHLEVVRRRRTGNNTTRHTHNERNSWLVFWREFG